MKTFRFLGFAFLAAIAVWMFFSHPLPRHALDGIPSSSQNTEKGQVRRMIPGDHLQMLYHYWLFGEMLTRHVPFFYNVYEFNTGEDSERYDPGAYYVPFSAIQLLGTFVAGEAFGYNLAQLVSLWLSIVFTWMLVRRYSSDPWVIAASSLACVALPYRWCALLGGSPTGTSMMWVPLIYFGLDMAVRDVRRLGAVLAGLGLLFLSWADKNTFFMAVWSVPAWCVLALFFREDLARMRFPEYLTAFRHLLITAAFLVVAVALVLLSSTDIGASTMKSGRDLAEIAGCSPRWKDIFAVGSRPGFGYAYVGWACFGCVVSAALLTLGNRKQGRARWQFLAGIMMLILCMVGLICLALGTNGPWEGIIMRAVRKIVPYYKMIRQPTKVMSLLPSFLALGVCLGFRAIAAAEFRRMIVRICAVAFCVALLCETRGKVRATVCIIEKKQPAYEFVAARAREAAQEPRALVVPLWPGDAHWASVYQHYASLYRIRLLNGYSPVVPHAYVKEIFDRFESVNRGFLSDSQLDELLSRKIGYVILHEDLFPEKVSAFAVGRTLSALLSHPRLEQLCHSGSVWSFKILAEPYLGPKFVPEWSLFPPARQWELEKCDSADCSVVEDPAAVRSAFMRMAVAGARLNLPAQSAMLAPDMGWLIRARGNAEIRYRVYRGSEMVAREPLVVSLSDWAWLFIPANVQDGHDRLALTITLEDGSVDMDTSILVAKPWTPPPRGEPVRLYACTFFHAGCTEPDWKSVRLRKDWEPVYPVLYGPKLPLDEGIYEVRIVYSSEAEPGTGLAAFTLEADDTRNAVWTSIVAGAKARSLFRRKSNFPVYVNLQFTRNADVVIKEIIFTRLEEGIGESEKQGNGDIPGQRAVPKPEKSS